MTDVYTQMAPVHSDFDAGQRPPEPDYRDWRTEDTRVITYELGPAQTEPDTARHRARSLAAARREVTKRFGRILDVKQTPFRAFFRVFKPELGRTA